MTWYISVLAACSFMSFEIIDFTIIFSKFQRYIVSNPSGIRWAFTKYCDVTSNFVNPIQSILFYTIANVVIVYQSTFFFSPSYSVTNNQSHLWKALDFRNALPLPKNSIKNFIITKFCLNNNRNCFLARIGVANFSLSILSFWYLKVWKALTFLYAGLEEAKIRLV